MASRWHSSQISQCDVRVPQALQISLGRFTIKCSDQARRMEQPIYWRGNMDVEFCNSEYCTSRSCSQPLKRHTSGHLISLTGFGNGKPPRLTKVSLAPNRHSGWILSTTHS